MASKKMLIDEVRGKDSTELRFDLQEIRKQLFHRKFQPDTEQTDTSSIRDLRRSVARIITVLRERDASEAASSEGQS